MKTRQVRKLMRTEGWRKWRRFRRDVLRTWWFKKIQGIIKEVFKLRFIQFIATLFEANDDYIFKELRLPSLGHPDDEYHGGSLTLKILFHDWINDNFNCIQVTSSCGRHRYQLHKEITHDDEGFIRFRRFESRRSVPESLRAARLALSELDLIDLSSSQ
jgi:hypothetical protein